MLSICLLALTIVSIYIIIVSAIFIIAALYHFVENAIYTIGKWNRNRLSKKKVHINGDKCGEKCAHLPMPSIMSKARIYEIHGNYDINKEVMRCGRHVEHLKHTHDYNYIPDSTAVLSTFTRCDECLKEFPIKKKGKK